MPDLWIARRLAHTVSTPVEHVAKTITWAADEKLMMTVVGLAWVGIRMLDGNARDRRRADHLLLTTVASAMLPHLLKHLVRRERPDRQVEYPPRHGVPRSGNPFDSFPSGHAMHLGAVASALSRWVPRPWRDLIWPVTLGIAATRVVLLAHWLTDVVAGLTAGFVLERIIHRYGPLAGAEQGQEGQARTSIRPRPPGYP
jgi:membrane-associated phospholipid phosphatase